jgi:hypothetical protein
MKKQINDLWILELRSGKYKEGKDQLRTVNNEWCPLGVLCDLAVSHNEVVRELDKNGYLYGGFRFQADPKTVTWAGLKNPHGFCPQIGFTIPQLMVQGKDFVQIAELLEKFHDKI